MARRRGLKPRPWLICVGPAGAVGHRFATLRAAQRAVDKPYLPGFVRVRHSRTGASLKRVEGGWYAEDLLAPATPAEAEAAGPDAAPDAAETAEKWFQR